MEGPVYNDNFVKKRFNTGVVILAKNPDKSQH